MQAMIPFPDISPEIFTISLGGFEFALRWYAMAYIVGILIAWRITVRAVETPRLWNASGAPMNKVQVEDFLTWAILGVIVGGRLGFVLFYQPGYYLSNPQDILKVWQGGMAFHGGMLGVVIAGWIYCARHNLPKLSVADVVVLGVPVGLLLGRIANFTNAELWGRATDLPWGVAFPGFDAQNCGQLAGVCARHPSQLYEAFLEGAVLLAVLLWLAWRKDALKTPGRITGTFFAGYGFARFLVEFVRQPDLQFISDGNPLGLALQLNGYGLTMGQILSLPMILGGLWLMRRAATVRA
ncbi:prolipoprotein diacylglyceryl transferase [Cognatishimia activa]|uniref:Phosphatidylglycerol--prolipoprotein diacylglyceryl transferase n=1 Tax=Cognatishimia activa TaxID=1715691 RepID=A0A0P1ISB5_9RHOB|nr:prolipoprotein diacylglyceryl transferase [Cognatishimia activa]CUI64056.1 Prolipoprotein diacylglyceryl transferase [Cognatishimia activa]CUK26377.1 Prolipoprotein diacylglyceryl transferase [Cognatishimia activa]